MKQFKVTSNPALTQMQFELNMRYTGAVIVSVENASGMIVHMFRWLCLAGTNVTCMAIPKGAEAHRVKLYDEDLRTVYSTVIALS